MAKILFINSVNYLLKLIKTFFYSNYRCTFVLRKEAITQPKKNLIR